MSVFVGIDVGTSACRVCAIDTASSVLAISKQSLPDPEREGACVEQQPGIWWQTLTDTLDELFGRIPRTEVQRIAIDATSATLLLSGTDGRPLTKGLMYNDARAIREARLIAGVAPAESPARGAASSLSKLLHLRRHISGKHYLALHQADWLSGKLCGRFSFSDENNALKLGYDPVRRSWPDWIRRLGVEPQCLPRVVPPGTCIGRIDPALARRWRLPYEVEIVAGTTDSTAGFIATGARRCGSAVTSLGSTLVIKVLSEHPVYGAEYGVYSHRLGERWLAGGASNAGGKVLQQFFSPAQIERYSRLLRPGQPTGLNYYPLPGTGERFPVYDPDLAPRLEPRPASDAEFFQGILEGLARIEQRGYRLLAELGAPYPTEVLSVGGGARNRAWRQIRQELLGVPVRLAEHQEAAYGAALLARAGGKLQ